MMIIHSAYVYKEDSAGVYQGGFQGFQETPFVNGSWLGQCLQVEDRNALIEQSLFIS